MGESRTEEFSVARYSQLAVLMFRASSLEAGACRLGPYHNTATTEASIEEKKCSRHESRRCRRCTLMKTQAIESELTPC